MSDWVNGVNEPDSVPNQPQTNNVDFNSLVRWFNNAVIPGANNVTQMRQATLPVRSSADVIVGTGQSRIPRIGISSVPTILRPNSKPPSLAAVNPLPIFQLPPVNTTSNIVSFLTVPVVNQQSLTLFPQLRPFATLGSTIPQVNIQTSHVSPNLSPWTFPALSSLPTVHATVPLPNTIVAPIVTKTGIFTPVVPIQTGGTSFYCNPPATTTPIMSFPIQQSTTTPVNVPFPTFPTTVQSTVRPAPPTAVTVQDLAQLLTDAKKTIFLSGN